MHMSWVCTKAASRLGAKVQIPDWPLSGSGTSDSHIFLPWASVSRSAKWGLYMPSLSHQIILKIKADNTRERALCGIMTPTLGVSWVLTRVRHSFKHFPSIEQLNSHDIFMGRDTDVQRGKQPVQGTWRVSCRVRTEGTWSSQTKPTQGCVQSYTWLCVIIIKLPPFPSVLI